MGKKKKKDIHIWIKKKIGSSQRSSHDKLEKKKKTFMLCGSLLQILKHCQFIFPPLCMYSLYPICVGLLLLHVFSLAGGIRDGARNILRDHFIKNLLP